jgi:hypothetical protein
MKDRKEDNGTTPLNSKARAKATLSGESRTATELRDSSGDKDNASTPQDSKARAKCSLSEGSSTVMAFQDISGKKDNTCTPLDSKPWAKSLLSEESSRAIVFQDRSGVELTRIFDADIQPVPDIPEQQLLNPAGVLPGAFPIRGPGLTMSNTGNDQQASSSILPHRLEVQLSAHLVEDDCHVTADIQGTTDAEQESSGKKTGFYWVLAICFILALVTMLLFLLGPKHQDTSERGQVQSDSSASQTTRYPPFQSNLSQDVSAAIQDEGSPFYMANLWVLEDPYLHLYSESRKAQRFYLVMLYYATNGNGWTKQDNWHSYEVSECDWYSHSSLSEDSKYYEAAVCDSSSTNTTVINLSLASNNLTGSLPIWYTSFIPQLRILDLANNYIGGAYPTMTSTPVLEVLVLSNNPLEGAVRLNAGFFFDNLKVLNADGTLIRGNNGGKLYYGISRDLEMMNLTGMPSDGQIWTELGMMTSLEYFGCGHNNITGTIPTELGLATSLKKLDLSSIPYLHGTIPSELGLLTHLTLWDLSETPIRGMVPAPLCDRVHAGLLQMHANCSTVQCCSDS